MEEIVKKNILDAIDYILKFQHQDISDEKRSKANEKIITYVEDNYDFSDVNFSVIRHDIPLLLRDKRIYPIVIKYYAITQDNLDLLKKLEEEDFSFLGLHHVVKFFALDKQLTNKFKEKDFIKYIKKYDTVFEHFYGTLRGLDHKEREQYFKDFAEIIKSDPTTLKIGDNSSINCNFLTRRNIELFGKDYLINTSDKQRNLINTFSFHIDEDSIDKIKELIEKYPDINISFPLYNEMFNDFTIDELGNMSEKNSRIYEAAVKNHIVPRVKELLKERPDFDPPISFIRKEIFRVLDNDTILSLSDDAISEISSLRIPEMEKVLIFPVKKINKIVFMDKLKRKKEETIGIHKK